MSESIVYIEGGYSGDLSYMRSPEHHDLVIKLIENFYGAWGEEMLSINLMLECAYYRTKDLDRIVELCSIIFDKVVMITVRPPLNAGDFVRMCND